MTIEFRRGADRPVTVGDGIRTAHSLSFGSHYDPHDVAFGPIVALNDERLQPNSGYPDHRHRGVEIVTWVVSGSVRHQHDGVPADVFAGQAQVLAAGRGVTHAEVAGDAGARFVQTWLVDEQDAVPRYARHAPAITSRWTSVSPPLRSGARLVVARLEPERAITVPPAPRVMVFVTAGDLTSPAGPVGDGDALRLVDEPRVSLDAVTASEVLAWILPA